MFQRVLYRLVSILMVVVGLAVLSGCATFNADIQYIQTSFNHAQRTLDTLSSLSDLAAQPRLDDPAWVRQVEGRIETLRGLIAEARQMTPSEQFVGTHQAYLDAMGSLEQAIDLYGQAVELHDDARLQEARTYLDQARTGIDQLRAQIDGLRQGA